MELFEALKNRRSVRFYEDKPVELSKLNNILEAATWAPSAGNVQPWIFVLVRKKEALENIKNFSPGIIGSPSAIIVACIDLNKNHYVKGTEEEYIEGRILSIIDLAMACENAMLAALEFNLGTCAIRSFNRKAIEEILNLPNNIEPELLITVGYPKIQPKKPPKLSLEEVVYYEKYGVKTNE